MARHEQDREDLMREATALVERAEFRVRDSADTIFVGLRAGGELSVYLSADESYHFNAAGELRRAFKDGLLFKSERGELLAMQRQRTDGETQLVSRELTDAEQADFVQRVRAQLANLQNELLGGRLTVVREVAIDQSVTNRLIEWLRVHASSCKVASQPGLR